MNQAALALQAHSAEEEGDEAQQMIEDSNGTAAAAAAAAEALQGVASVVSCLLGEHGKRVPEALLAPATALHDSALLVTGTTPLRQCTALLTDHLGAKLNPVEFNACRGLAKRG